MFISHTLWWYVQTKNWRWKWRTRRETRTWTPWGQGGSIIIFVLLTQSLGPSTFLLNVYMLNGKRMNGEKQREKWIRDERIQTLIFKLIMLFFPQFFTNRIISSITPHRDTLNAIHTMLETRKWKTQYNTVPSLKTQSRTRNPNKYTLSLVFRSWRPIPSVPACFPSVGDAPLSRGTFPYLAAKRNLSPLTGVWNQHGRFFSGQVRTQLREQGACPWGSDTLPWG